MSKTDDVKEFHRAFRLPNGEASFDDKTVHTLRYELLEEEFVEYEDAMFAQDPEDMLDALADIVYVCIGTAIAFGWDFDEAFRRVHESNMSKLGPGGEPLYHDSGKVLKGPRFRAPKLADLVLR